MIREEMMDRMTAYEFMCWRAFFPMDPFGGIRGDIQASIVASTVANLSGKTLKKDLDAKEFIPDFKGEAKTVRRMQTPEEMVAAFLSVAKDKAIEKPKPS